MSNEIRKSEFMGYETTRIDDATVVSIAKSNDFDSLRAGDEGEIVLDRTPFYAESGGQVGDVGVLIGPTDALAVVDDTYSPAQGVIVHKVKVEQ